MVVKGCVMSLVALAAVFGAYFWVLQHLEVPVNLILSSFGSIGLLILLSSIYQVIFGNGNGKALKRALQGEPLREGEVEAVWGTIHALGDPIVAPITGQECVAYEYDVKRPTVQNDEGETREQGSDMAGMALTPSVIRSQRGNVRLMGFNMLTEFPQENLDDFPFRLEQAHAYLQATEFKQMGVTKIFSALSQMDEMLADDDGSVRQDWLMRKKEEIDLGSDRMSEKVIKEGDMVTAIGIWDPARGIVPRMGKRKTMIQLRPGGGETMVARATKRPWGMLLFALVWSGAAHAFIYFALLNAPGAR
ncbi:MAG: hypothetical protein ABIU58_13415 [Ramlibacter sp.]